MKRRSDNYTGVEPNRGFHVTHYDLDFDYIVGPNRLNATATLTLTTTEALHHLTLDMAEGLAVRRVESSISSGTVSYTHLTLPTNREV